MNMMRYYVLLLVAVVCHGVVVPESVLEPTNSSTSLNVTVDYPSDLQQLLNLNHSQHFQAQNQVFNFYGARKEEQLVRTVPQKYIVYNNEYAYKVYDTKKNWNTARNDCIRDGAHLAVIESEGQKTAILGEMQRNNLKEIWIGLHDQFKENEWTTVTDRTLGASDYLHGHWCPLEPNNVNKQEHCVMMTGTCMNDVQCDSQLPYACTVSLKHL